MQRVGLGKQHDVSGRELAAKTRPRWRITLGEHVPLEATAYQPGQLLTRVAGGAFEIAQHHPLIGPLEPAVPQAPEYRCDVLVAQAVLANRLELDRQRTVEKGA